MRDSDPEPSPEHLFLIRSLDAAAGSPKNWRRWTKIARSELKKNKGKPKKVDTWWLLCAEALQRYYDPTLSKTAAISKIAEMAWSPLYGSNVDAFRDRLLDAVRNEELAVIAESVAAKHKLRVEYNPRGFIHYDVPGPLLMGLSFTMKNCGSE